MGQKHWARLVLGVVGTGLAIAFCIPIPHAWIAGWALVVMAAAVCDILWGILGQTYTTQPKEEGKLPSDGVLPFFILMGAVTAIGLVLALVEGVGWGGAIATAILSLAGFFCSLVAALFAELEDLTKQSKKVNA